MGSWADKLAVQGFLTANGFVEYLREVAPILSVSYPTLMRYIQDGKIQAVRVGGQTRISKDEIERYIHAGEGADEALSSDPKSLAVLRLGERNV